MEPTDSIRIPLLNDPERFAVIDAADAALVQPRQWYRITFEYPGKQPVHYAVTSGTSMHRLILGLNDPKIEADHIDHDGLNNRRSNLRPATHQQNHRNRRPNGGTSSPFKGVSRYRNRWRADIHVDGKTIYLGCFTDEIDAARAYDAAARERFGQFAYLNLA